MNFGDDSLSVVVSFSSQLSTTSSVVVYSTNENDILSSTSLHIANGTVMTYSELIYITGYLYAPAMGLPTESPEDIINLENTANWAFDPQTKQPYANYKAVTKVQTGIGAYNNPYMYYDSPFIHSVTLSGLTPGETYYYRVSGSCEVFHFTLPEVNDPPATQGSNSESPGDSAKTSIYPFTVALTGDVGQTEVSNASMNALVAMDPDFVLIAGNNLLSARRHPTLWMAVVVSVLSSLTILSHSCMQVTSATLTAGPLDGIALHACIKRWRLIF